MKRRVLAVIAVAAITIVSTSGAAADTGLVIPPEVAGALDEAKSANYIVFMAADPTLGYDGGTAGYAPTAPARGRPVNRADRNVQRYVRHLQAEQDRALLASGAPLGAKLTSYTYAANGFAATLTGAQATALRGQPGVRFVVRDHIRHLQTSSIGDFLGLSGSNGPWSAGLTGENVVVGIIDTGIWPEHPSFVDDGTYPALPPAEFSGTGCDFGNTAFNPNDIAFTCNNKLLAAKSYGAVFHGGTGAGLVANSYLSARDEDGHGTHTASVSAGDANIAASVLGSDLGTISGVAPRARLSVYKACWASADGDGCSNGDLVSAIDAAVADGVDVINYSIGSDDAFIGPDAISFLLANQAGVFVAASAGNAGPGAATVGSPAVAPWVTAVGASSDDTDFRSTLTLGSGQTLSGASVTAGTAAVPLVDAKALGNVNCLAQPGFNPADVQGKMVLCARGVNGRFEKSKVVADAGGVAMVLYNTDANDTINTENFVIPAVHVDLAAGNDVRAYIESVPSGTASAQLSGATVTAVQPSVIASFSARGPNNASPDIISPDVTAPGLDIIGGNSPTALNGAPGQLFQAISGTSMSSPHVAGIFALVKQAHPDWSAAMAKSALMTTARQNVTKEDGSTPADPFDIGAGHVNPTGNTTTKGSLFDPGLVYDAASDDYLGYLCEAEPDSILPETCAGLDADGVPTTAENLNLASIGVADITGQSVVTRTITNVTSQRLTWQATVKSPPGFSVKIFPSRIRLRAGQSATFTITISRTAAAFDAWSFGSLTWTAQSYKVRSPIAVKSQQFAFPDGVSSTQAAGTLDVPISFGYNGAYQANGIGFVEATRTAGTVLDDPANDIRAAIGSNVGITRHMLNIPAGTSAARISTFDSDVDGLHDLDLYVFNGAGELVGLSTGGSSQEQVDLVAPAAGSYTVVVHGFAAANGVANYTLSSWVLPLEDGEGSLILAGAPATAVSGTTGAVSLVWASLTPGIRYLGAVTHTENTRLLGVTMVAVTP